MVDKDLNMLNLQVTLAHIFHHTVHVYMDIAVRRIYFSNLKLFVLKVCLLWMNKVIPSDILAAISAIVGVNVCQLVAKVNRSIPTKNLCHLLCKILLLGFFMK